MELNKPIFENIVQQLTKKTQSYIHVVLSFKILPSNNVDMPLDSFQIPRFKTNKKTAF